MSLVTKTYTGTKLEPYEDPEGAVVRSVLFGNSLTIAKGTVLGIVTTGEKWAAYANANSNGTEVARGIAMYDFTTDGSGKVTIGGDSSVTFDTAPIYVSGTFLISELTGLDANAVTDFGRIIEGTISAGILRIG